MAHIYFRFGSPKGRLGLVYEDWQKTPNSSHYSKALPENTEYEMVKLYGIFIGLTFIGIQRYSHKHDREKLGFQFGPEPNMLDVIRDSEDGG
jgi:hypothetical protein